jgi:hypothetical protein
MPFQPTNANIQSAVNEWCKLPNDTTKDADVYANTSIGDWDTSLVTSMEDLFKDKTTFNDNIGGWNTTKVETMRCMFCNCSEFNQDIGTKLVTPVGGGSSYIAWNTQEVTTMRSMFYNASKFNNGDNGSIGNWNTTKVESMRTVFYKAPAFNQNIGTKEVTVGGNTYTAWNTEAVTIMEWMFGYAAAFNQDINTWNISLVTVMRYMFYNATAFDEENTSEWIIGASVNITEMFGPHISVISPYIPSSNICFPAGTPVLTDQGEVDIDKIDPEKHTINANKIEGITETTSIENYMVMIEKHAFSEYVPCHDTIISANHKIMFGDGSVIATGAYGALFNNRMVQAREFLDKKEFTDKIYKVDYTGYPLYNVLLENVHCVMVVNNLVAETLSPTSVNAWLFRKMKSNISTVERKEAMDAYMQRVFPSPVLSCFIIGCK